MNSLEANTEQKIGTADVVGINLAVQDKTSKTQLQHCAKAIEDIVKKYSLTAQQLRYVFKRVRNQTALALPKRPKRLPDFLNASEIYMLLSTAQQVSAKHRLLCEVLIMTGLRINELRNLDVRDLDFQNNQIKVVKGKGNKERQVPITNNLLHKIKLYLRDRTSNYVFLNRQNQQYSVRMLQHCVEKVIKKCQLQKKLSTHSLRHTFACLCLAKGLRLEQIQLLMGHSSYKTTEIYARMELGAVKEQYLQLMGDL